MKRNISETVSAMSLKEKADLCSGGDFWHTKEIKRHNIPSIMMADGPHGLRKITKSSGPLDSVKRIPVFNGKTESKVYAKYHIGGCFRNCFQNKAVLRILKRSF